MKNFRFVLFTATMALALSSCGLLSKPKYGCGTNGKNVGAEQLLSNPPKKSPKFKA